MDEDESEYKILTGDFNADFDEFSVFGDYTRREQRGYGIL